MNHYARYDSERHAHHAHTRSPSTDAHALTDPHSSHPHRPPATPLPPHTAYLSRAAKCQALCATLAATSTRTNTTPHRCRPRLLLVLPLLLLPLAQHQHEHQICRHPPLPQVQSPASNPCNPCILVSVQYETKAQSPHWSCPLVCCNKTAATRHVACGICCCSRRIGAVVAVAALELPFSLMQRNSTIRK